LRACVDWEPTTAGYDEEKGVARGFFLSTRHHPLKKKNNPAHPGDLQGVGQVFSPFYIPFFV
jgi:hypothetical protein